MRPTFVHNDRRIRTDYSKGGIGDHDVIKNPKELEEFNNHKMK